jgi:hypothetical protein
VLTLCKEGALKQFEKMLQDCKVGITVLWEIHWIGQGVLEKKNCSLSAKKKK